MLAEQQAGEHREPGRRDRADRRRDAERRIAEAQVKRHRAADAADAGGR